MILQPAYETDPIRRAAGRSYAAINNTMPLCNFMKGYRWRPKSKSAKAVRGGGNSVGETQPTAPVTTPKEAA